MTNEELQSSAMSMLAVRHKAPLGIGHFNVLLVGLKSATRYRRKYALDDMLHDALGKLHRERCLSFNNAKGWHIV